jgi:Tol biopolymer transport system component
MLHLHPSRLSCPLALVLFCATSRAQIGPSVRLNGPLARAWAGSVIQSAVTPDGSTVLYLANGTLYRVSITGGASTALDDPPGHCSSYRLSADGTRVAFTEQDATGGDELFAVDLAGGPVVPLAQAFTFSDVLSSDGAWVVYVSGLEGTDQLFAVPSAGGLVRRLNSPLVERGRVRSFEITPDGSRVVYLADQEVAGRDELYGVPIDGGAPPVKLNPPVLSSHGRVERFALSSDSRRVAFLGELDALGSTDLFSAPVAGGASVQLDLTVPAVRPTFSAFSPDGARIVYNGLIRGRSVLDTGRALLRSRRRRLRADPPQSAPLPAGGNAGGFDISRTPRASCTRATRSSTSPSACSACRSRAARARRSASRLPSLPSSFELTPDGSRVLLVTASGLFSVPLAGGPVAALLAAPVQPLVTRDGRRVVFLDPDFTLRSAPVDGSAPSTALYSGVLPFRFYPSPDGRFVLFEVPREHAETPELFRISITGGRLATLSAPLVPTDRVVGNVRFFQFTPDQSPSSTGRTREDLFDMGLHGVPADGSLPARRLDPDLGWNDVPLPDFQFTEDGRHLVFRRTSGVSPRQSFELFCLPWPGGSPVRLGAADAMDAGGLAFAVDPSGRRVAYLADEDGDGQPELRGVPVDGGASVRWAVHPLPVRRRLPVPLVPRRCGGRETRRAHVHARRRARAVPGGRGRGRRCRALQPRDHGNRVRPSKRDPRARRPRDVVPDQPRRCARRVLRGPRRRRALRGVPPSVALPFDHPSRR